MKDYFLIKVKQTQTRIQILAHFLMHTPLHIHAYSVFMHPHTLMHINTHTHIEKFKTMRS